MKRVESSSEKTASMHAALREAVTLCFWIFAIVKLFIYDIDSYLIQRFFSNAKWLLDYKFFVLLTIISCYWLIAGSKVFFITAGFILFYPFIWIFWRIPKFLIGSKSWVLTFTVIGFILTFFRSLKVNFIAFTLAAISGLLIVITDEHRPLLLLSGAILFLLLVGHFIRRFYYSFQPARVFSLQSNVISAFWNRYRKNAKITEDIKRRNTSRMSDKQRQNWVNHIQTLVIINKLCYFLTSKLRNFQRSHVVTVSYLLNIVFTIFLTITIFGFQNYALQKININSFSDPSRGSLLFSLYYSFNTIFSNSISDYYPISNWARLFQILEMFFGFLILVILFFVMTTIRRDKYKEEIDTVITSINNQGKELEKYLHREFKISTDEAIRELEKLRGSLLNVIYYFASKIEPPE